jgi:hypothetical protein
MQKDIKRLFEAGYQYFALKNELPGLNVRGSGLAFDILDAERLGGMGRSVKQVVRRGPLEPALFVALE